MNRRLKLAAALSLFVLFAAPGGFVIFLTTTSGVQWMRQLILRQVEQRTGTHVEMGSFSFNLWRLRFEIAGLTVHGLEPPGYPPLFRANRVELGVRVISFFRRQVALEDLFLDRPEIFVRFDDKGQSNVPPQHPAIPNRPWRDTLFSLRVGHLELRDGAAIYNDYRVPLAVAGNNLNFNLRHFSSAAATPDSYVGDLQWQQVQFTEKRNAPFSLDLSTKFTLHRDSFELDDLNVKLPHSEFGLRAELASFTHPDWDLHYRGKLALADIRTIYRAPTTPDAIADFAGQAHYAFQASGLGDWTATGHYNGHDVRMTYRYFHASGFETWGDYQIANGVLSVPNLNVRALGGALDGHLEMAFRGLAFRTETHMHGASLAATLAAVHDRDTLPVNTLHWTGSMDVDSVNTWEKNFQKFRTIGETRWSSALIAGQPVSDDSSAATIPTTAKVRFDYDDSRGIVSLANGTISTPRMQLNMDGFLGKDDSALEVKFRADDLLDWNDFIKAIRGPDSPKARVSGSATWNGRVLGPLVGPTFSGHVRSNETRYDQMYWQEIDGDMEYSPDGFTLTKTSVRRGSTSANLDLSLHFDGDWNFTLESPWSLTVDLQHAPSDDLQAILDTSYPVAGFLTGTVRAGGTRGAPHMDSDFSFDQIKAANMQFDLLTAQLHVDPSQFRLSRANLRRGTGNVSGNVLYLFQNHAVAFDLNGSSIALEGIPQLMTSSLPLGGRLDFSIRGSGPLQAPIAQANVRVENLKLGSEIQGNFRGDVTSDGHSALLVLSSELAKGRLDGRITLGYGGDEPITGQLTASQVDLDPIIVAAAHLKQLTGHSSADGTFNITGSLRQPDSIEVDANITRISFDYEFVQLTNDQPVQFAYRRNEIRLGQAHVRGTDTDLELTGNVRFDRDRAMRFSIAGGVNLRLLRGFLPDLQAQGRADANVSVEGTMSQPRITGRATVRDASATYADFPIGLSKLNGDLLFDTNRLVFDRVSAESGGGQLMLSGSLNYGEGPLRYEISAATPNVRIRYPTGMSWLAGGTVQLSGTQNAAVLSGRIQVQRLLFAQGVDLASFFASTSEPSADVTTTSTFLRNLTFDIEGQTNPGARIEWTGAQIEMDGNVRLRGTWSRPVLLGHIHLIDGQMPFRGNTYQLTRGDINFANPFRLDPILNVEATSTISQYQVTIDFSGPASHLTLNYRSDPPLPDSDIIALLALGTPGESSALRSASASQNYGATALLSEAISSGLGGRIEKLFGISQFRVDPFVAGTATESNAAARITIEQQVKNKLTITYSTNAATSNQYQLIQVEYAVKRDLSVLFLRDINGTNGFDIKWVKHFK